LPSESDVPAATIPDGSRVKARGDEWTTVRCAAYDGCESVLLEGAGAANLGHARVLLRPFDRIEPIPREERLTAATRREWLRHVAGAVLAAHPSGGLRMAARASVDLLPFQLEPALAMLRHARLRLVLADEVGLGKTIQAGLILGELAVTVHECRALILAPAGLREQWRSELESRFALHTILADTTWLLAADRSLPAGLNPWSLPGLYVASIDLIKRAEVLRALEDVTWDLVVIDEAHGVSAGTDRLAAARAVTNRSRRVLLLTATPPFADPEHMQALCGLGRAPTEEPITLFRRTRASIGLASGRRSRLLAVRPTRGERAMHRALERYTTTLWREAGARGDDRARLVAVILRKRALSSAAALASTVRRRLELLAVHAPLDAEQLLLPLRDEDPLDDVAVDTELGSPGLTDAALERELLEAVADRADRAAAAESKMRTLVRLLRRVRQPAIVFTEYRDTLARIAAALPSSLPCLVLHGGLSPHERDAVQRQFNASPSLLLATDAASEGLNLHHRCRLVVHFELPWNPARLEQRTGRVDRIGQARTVHEILLVSRDTAERTVLSPLVRRLRAAGAVGGRTWSLPGESLVAQAIMSCTDAGPVTGPETAETLELNLRDEAGVEATRLLNHRRLRTVRGRRIQHAPDRSTLVHVERIRHQMTAVVLVTLRDGAGRTTHAEIVPLSVRLAERPSSRLAVHARCWAGWVIARAGDLITSRALLHTAPSIDRAREALRRQTAAVRRREAFIAQAFEQSRFELQGSLFDRRAERMVDRWRQVAVDFADDSTARMRAMPAADAIDVDARIVALRA
jgi:superfamily II DNA or RNA helicase